MPALSRGDRYRRNGLQAVPLWLSGSILPLLSLVRCTNSGSLLRSVVSVGITSRRTLMDDVPHVGETTRTKLFSSSRSNRRSASASLPIPKESLTVFFCSHKRLTQQKKRRERERKDLDTLGRRHLTNVRVVQRNIVYIVNMNPRFAKEEVRCAATYR